MPLLRFFDENFMRDYNQEFNLEGTYDEKSELEVAVNFVYSGEIEIRISHSGEDIYEHSPEEKSKAVALIKFRDLLEAVVSEINQRKDSDVGARKVIGSYLRYMADYIENCPLT